MQPKTKNSLALLGCLFLLYISWGSSFLMTKIGLNYFPGIMLSGCRMLVAGILLYTYSVVCGEKTKITIADVRQNMLLGFFLVFMASGLLTKGQEYISSGFAAILCGAVPIWMVLAEWLFFGGKRPALRQCIGLAVGFMALVGLHMDHGGEQNISFFGVSLAIVSTWAWVFGSNLSKKYSGTSAHSLVRSSSFLMIIGGLETLFFALLAGERFSEIVLTVEAVTVFTVLVLLSSIVGYISYFWLLYHARSVVAISYEYVNPVIALYLGWLFLGEQVDLNMLIMCGVMVSSVFLVVSHGKE